MSVDAWEAFAPALADENPPVVQNEGVEPGNPGLVGIEAYKRGIRAITTQGFLEWLMIEQPAKPWIVRYIGYNPSFLLDFLPEVRSHARDKGVKHQLLAYGDLGTDMSDTEMEHWTRERNVSWKDLEERMGGFDFQLLDLDTVRSVKHLIDPWRGFRCDNNFADLTLLDSIVGHDYFRSVVDRSRYVVLKDQPFDFNIQRNMGEEQYWEARYVPPVLELLRASKEAQFNRPGILALRFGGRYMAG